MDLFDEINEYLQGPMVVSVEILVCCDEFSAYRQGTYIYLEDNTFSVEQVACLN